MLRLNLARLRGDLPVVVEEARRLVAPAGTLVAAQLGLGEELRAMALLSLGTTESRTVRFEEAEQHLEQARALAVRIGRPYLEFSQPRVPGDRRDSPVVRAGHGVQHPGHRTGRAARLDR